MINKTTELEANAKKALKHPKIKRAIQCIKMMRKYGERNWYKYDADMNVIKTPSDRMQTWANDLELFASDIRTAWQEDKELDTLWEAYCKVNGEDTEIRVDCFVC